MAGAGDVYVTSWGWLDEDGRSSTVDAPSPYRLWKVHVRGDPRGFLALSVDLDALDALTAAYRVWGDDV